MTAIAKLIDCAVEQFKIKDNGEETNQLLGTVVCIEQTEIKYTLSNLPGISLFLANLWDL